MKKIGLFVLVVLSLFMIPNFVKVRANETTFTRKDRHSDEIRVISQNVKYLKTVTVYDNVVRDSYGNIISADVLSSEDYELTKEEWDQADFNEPSQTRDQTVVSTYYRMMTGSLIETIDGFRYMNQIDWLTMPDVRAFDVIGIGHANDVAPNSTPVFELEYVTTANQHLYGLFCYHQSFSNGDSATFTLPLENLQSLMITYYYDIKKIDPDDIIAYQEMYADYAHSVDPDVTFSDAINHDVNGALGIMHDASVYDMFDLIDEADVYWYGIW